MELDLVDQVAPIQLAIRLLLPEGSLLLDLPEIRAMVEPFDPRALCYPGEIADPRLDALCASIQGTIKREERRAGQPARNFPQDLGAGRVRREFPDDAPMAARATIPYLTEPWYC